MEGHKATMTAIQLHTAPDNNAPQSFKIPNTHNISISTHLPKSTRSNGREAIYHKINL